MNYYEIPGVSHNAETEVIKAAYRALSKKYHPDTTSLDPKEANQRMQDVNLAYDTLSNVDKRKQYDNELRLKNRQSETHEESSKTSVDETERAWRVAVDYYPYLASWYQDLSKLSPQLAQSFKSVIIKKKDYESAFRLAKSLERDHLSRIFGPNDDFQLFGKELILDGNDKAIEELRITISVIGDKRPPYKVIRKIREKYYGRQDDPPRQSESKFDPTTLITFAILFFFLIALLSS